MNESRRRTIRAFNPGTFQSDEEIIRQFVVRQRELGVVLDILRRNIKAFFYQPVLVVAPRGQGKTMLLARVAAALNTDTELSEHFLPVRFMEESHEIFNLEDFWLETLFYLARESAEHDSGLAQELQEAHADLVKRWNEEALVDHARATVLEAADRLGKKLVLMVENIQDLYENVNDDFSRQLGGTLQSESQIVLLATATSRSGGADDVEQPFLELSRTIDLEPLDTEECRRLWKVISGEDVSGRDIRPLEILTGGSPRLLVIVGGFARSRSLSQLLEEVVQLIDDHTEYFRGHLEALAKTERRVYLAAVDLWRPSSTGEIAERARMDVRTVSALLGRLVDRGMVTVERIGKKRLYVAAERLYSIYYKLRRERDEAAVVSSLIHFMAVFYSPKEMAERLDRLIAEAKRFPGIRTGIERAIAEAPDIAQLFPGVAEPQVAYKSVPDTTDGNECIERLLEEIAAMFQKAEAHKEAGDWASAIMIYDELIVQFDSSDDPDIQAQVAWALSGKGDVQRELEDFASAIATYEEVIKSLGDCEAPECQYLASWALSQKGDVHLELNDFDAALAVYDEVIERFGCSDIPIIQALVAGSLSDKGYIFGHSFGDDAQALAAYDEVIERFGDSDEPELQDQIVWALRQKGIFQGQLGDFTSALVVYDEIIVRFGDSESLDIQASVAWTLFEKADAHLQLGDFTAAIAACNEIIERFGASDAEDLRMPVVCALFDKGIRQLEMGHAEEALRTREEFTRRSGALSDLSKIGCALRAIWMRTPLLMASGSLEVAMEIFRSMYVLFVPGEATMTNEMQKMAPDLIAAGVPPHHLVEILSSDTIKAIALRPLIVALLQYAGETARAPVEVLEVAADIRKRIEERMAGGAGVDVPTFPGTGLMPGVDLSDSASLSDLMEEDRE